MVTSSTLLTLALGALAVSAAPKPAAPEKLFSFENWVLDTIKNPETALSPEQALDAYYTSVNATALEARGTTAALSGPVTDLQARDSSLHKRVTCDNRPSSRTLAVDAVWCINYLAGLGQTACVVDTGAIRFCNRGTCALVGSKGQTGLTQSPCQKIAQTAGRIMDVCTRSDQTVQGSEYAIDNPRIWVTISSDSP